MCAPFISALPGLCEVGPACDKGTAENRQWHPHIGEARPLRDRSCPKGCRAEPDQAFRV